ncbi:DUF4062 domain-containing protein [Deinococcus lacus]|uniref:DUF4062 domain-containing protein n=1 Tax=Deinococcus lacus TaxID=392561 RepID=A0ABW1YDN6_9DEIO
MSAQQRKLLSFYQMEKRYTVFISSTYEDLKEERDAVTKAVMKIGHIPLGMEAFGAADASQWEIITDTIDKADYYVLIIGGRYGSIDAETGMSYTEKEFRYAKAQGIPCLVFPVHDSVPILPKYVDNPERLAEFRSFALDGRTADFWRGPEDLALRVNAALTQAFNRSPRPGWVRPSPQVSSEVAEQLARLAKEKDELQVELQRFKTRDGIPELDVQFVDESGEPAGREKCIPVPQAEVTCKEIRDAYRSRLQSLVDKMDALEDSVQNEFLNHTRNLYRKAYRLLERPLKSERQVVARQGLQEISIQSRYSHWTMESLVYPNGLALLPF